MSELEPKLDPTKETPAATTAQPDKAIQPTPVVPDPAVQLKEIQDKLAQEEAKAKRYLEQLHGKDKLIEELKIKKIVETFTQPTKVEPVEQTYAESSEPIKTVKQAPDPEDIERALYVNASMMRDRFGNDPDVPWTDEVKRKVEAKLEELDPSGRAKLSPKAMESAYKIVRGEILPEVVRAKEEKVRAELAEKDKIRIASMHVEQTTPSTPTKTGPTIEDVISGKIKMSPKEMLLTFPELQSQVSKGTLKQYGIIK